MLQDGKGGAASSVDTWQYNYVCSAPTEAVRVKALCVPVVGNDGELCCTALSSSSSRSSSDRLLPSADVMAAVDEADDFCLFGKLQRRRTETSADSSHIQREVTDDTVYSQHAQSAAAYL